MRLGALRTALRFPNSTVRTLHATPNSSPVEFGRQGADGGRPDQGWVGCGSRRDPTEELAGVGFGDQ
jgi:hypothetical protein